MSSKAGPYGYADVWFRDKIGPEGRFEVRRKLGWGQYSSVWLAWDSVDHKYVSVKILTSYATTHLQSGNMQELDILKRLDTNPNIGLHLISDFILPDKDGDSPHQCLVTTLFSSSLGHLAKHWDVPILPRPLAKKIVRDVLEDLVEIHRVGIIHTDIKLDNILATLPSDDSTAVDRALKDVPSSRYPPCPSLSGEVEVAKSQPVLLPSLAEAITRKYCIGDFGQGQFLEKRITDHITSELVRAPETILRGPWDQKVDIWSFGCLLYEIVTGDDMFVLSTHPLAKHLPREVVHLYLMIGYGQKPFSLEQLADSKRAKDYFDEGSTDLRAWPRMSTLDYRVQVWNPLMHETDQSDHHAIAALLQRCLCLNPKDRPTAADLLDDPWWSM